MTGQAVTLANTLHALLGADVTGQLLVKGVGNNLQLNNDGGVGSLRVFDSAGIIQFQATAVNGTDFPIVIDTTTNPHTLTIGRAGGQLTFFGGAGAVQPTITGSRTGVSAVALSILAALVSLGLVIDGTTP